LTSTSPYAPPASALEDIPRAGQTGGLGPRTTIRIGEAVKYPFTDPEWLRRSAVMGLMMLVPLVGPLVLLGWMAQVAARVRSGTPGLPPLDFGAQLGTGARCFVSMVAFVSVGLVLDVSVHCVFGFLYFVFVFCSEEGGEGGFIFVLLALLCAQIILVAHTIFAVITAPLMPELLRRGFVGELFPLASPCRSIRRVRRAGRGYVLAVLGIVLLSLMGGLGLLAVVFGACLTLPLCCAAMSHIVYQWEAVSGGPDIAV
jgi:hypothetical protein